MGKYYKHGLAYIAELPEEEWHGVSDEDRHAIITDMRKQAAIYECTGVAIFSIPDPIFPMYGETKKTRVFSDTVTLPSKKTYEIQCMYTGKIDAATWDQANENVKVRLLRTVRDALNARGETQPGRYQIVVVRGDQTKVIEGGRV